MTSTDCNYVWFFLGFVFWLAIGALSGMAFVLWSSIPYDYVLSQELTTRGEIRIAVRECVIFGAAFGSFAYGIMYVVISGIVIATRAAWRRLRGY